MIFDSILGGPGTGKTTALLDVVERHIKAGLSTEMIAFVSFTKKAAREAAERAVDKFNLPIEGFPYFRTIHSICYHELELTRPQIMQDNDWESIATALGLDYKQVFLDDGPVVSGSEWQQLMGMVSYADATKQTVTDVWNASSGDIDYYKLLQFYDTIIKYKQDTGKIDFTDMLTLYQATGRPLPVRLAIVDEAQDLSKRQWETIDHMLSNARRLVIGGDDDQAIFKWSGADVDEFIARVKQSDDVKTISQSHRLPKPVLLLSRKIQEQIPVNHRIRKWLTPTDKEGKVEYITDPAQVDLTNGETWMVLARNAKFLPPLKAMCVDQGVAYRWASGQSVDEEHIKVIQAWEALKKGKEIPPELQELITKYLSPKLKMEAMVIWHDALTGIPLRKREHYLSILRSGGDIRKPPKVYVGTIHSVKGGEADNVLLMTDIAYRSYQAYMDAPDDEHRVFYVGATRPIKALYICLPRTNMAYEF